MDSGEFDRKNLRGKLYQKVRSPDWGIVYPECQHCEDGRIIELRVVDLGFGHQVAGRLPLDEQAIEHLLVALVGLLHVFPVWVLAQLHGRVVLTM